MCASQFIVIRRYKMLVSHYCWCEHWLRRGLPCFSTVNLLFFLLITKYLIGSEILGDYTNIFFYITPSHTDFSIPEWFSHATVYCCDICLMVILSPSTFPSTFNWSSTVRKSCLFSHLFIQLFIYISVDMFFCKLFYITILTYFITQIVPYLAIGNSAPIWLLCLFNLYISSFFKLLVTLEPLVL